MKKLNKIFLTLALALFFTSAFAIEKDPCLPKDVCCEEPAAGPFAFSYPKDVGLACPRDFYLHGEFLWMKPTEEGLEFAMDQDDTSTSHTIFPLTTGKVKGFSSDSQEWDWRPGFRVGFGFYPMHDAWNVAAEWTYLRIKADSEVTNGGSGILLPLWFPPSQTIDYKIDIYNALSRWSGDCNTMDIMIGKPYHVSRYYISNPMFGIRAAWIDQDYHIRYFYINTKQNAVLKNDFWGLGLRSFYEGQFLLGSGWLLYGKASFALLFGKFDISQQLESDPSVNYKTEDSFYTVQPNAEIGFGISWSKFIHKNQYQISVKVGYEFHQWWDQNQARKFFATDPTANDTVSRGDLAFNGFMFGLHIEF